MPHISTPSKIAATQGHGATVIFSGSTAAERESVATEVLSRTGGLLVPPYDHPDIILGQGTAALEFEAQFSELVSSSVDASVGGRTKLDAVITPCGGGGLLSGTAITFSGTGTRVFGAEPEFEGADDARRGLLTGQRIKEVSSSSIADGVRTPVGAIPWKIISDSSKVAGVFAVTEEQIKDAWRLLMERMKVFVEPTAALGLAVCLYNEDFRKLVESEGGNEGWNVGIILSGGNTTMEMIVKAFGSHA
jgi:threonine dehydratase